MAELLAKWLNEEITLSQKITNFEKDFSSGYLIGELLYKFNQQDNFAEFSTKDNISTKVKNFEKLEPTLRNLNIKFDSVLVDKIMKQERGYALRLLYQLKMILEKVYPPTDIAILRKTGKVGDNQPALKIGPNKEVYNKMQHQFFKTRLQALNKPQKMMNMESHLKQFEDEAQRQAMEAERYHNDQKEEQARIKQEIRRAQINKLQRNAGFMEEWLQKGVEDWKQNMAFKKEREQSQLEFEYGQAQKFNQMTLNKIESATNEVIDGIAQFEATLQDNGINPRVTKEAAEAALEAEFTGSSPVRTMRTQKLTQQLLSKPTMGLGGTMTKTGGVTLASVGLRSKAKKPLDEKGRKERERRRMRMITDQSNLLIDIEKSRREAEVLDRMKRVSKQEEELNYEAWRTNQCRTIIEENRKLREAKYDKRHDLDNQNAIFKEKQMLDSMQEQMTREIETLGLRDEFLRQKAKEAKKLRQTQECQKMVDAIFEIANEAYNHQQKQDSSEMDPRNLHEWLTAFVEGVPILTVEESSKQTEASSNAEHFELIDYLENKGQWPTTLVTSNKPNLEQILNGAADTAPAAGKGKAPAKGAAETVALDEGDTELSDKPANNTFVGDAVEQIINLNFEDRGRQLRPKNPHYLNLKLCFVGYAFAGKRLQAMKLKQEYGLDTFTLSDLVEESLKFFQDHPTPIVKEPTMDQAPIQESLHEESKIDEMEGAEMQDSPPVERMSQADAQSQMNKTGNVGLGLNPLLHKTGPSKKKNDDDVKSEKSELEEEVLNPEEDFRLCGEKIQNCLYEGQEIPDQLYVELYVAKLRMTYAYKDKDTLTSECEQQAQEELNLTRQIANLLDEAAQLKDPNSNIKRKKKRTADVVEKEVAALQERLAQIQAVEKKGWILIDFPANFSQAMLLEKALSGYQQVEDLEPTQREKEQAEANMLVKPTERPPPPKKLIPSGLDAVIWFDCSREECLRRALGRRIDSQNNMIYHIQDNPPSIEKSPLCEVIEPIDDESESMACLIDRWVAFDQTRNGLEKWLTRFGDEYTGTNLLTKIEASGDINSVHSQIDQVLSYIVDQKMRKQALKRSTIQSKIIRDEENAERVRAKQINEDGGDIDGKSGSQVADDKSQASRSQANRSVAGKSNKSQRLDGNSAVTNQSVMPERDNIEEDFKGILFALWKQISTNFKAQMKRAFGKQRVQREHIQQHFYDVQVKFLTFLKRLDDKENVLTKFIKDFNDFSDQYPDMREDDHTKEELHQRTDILSDEMWEIAEERKEQAIEERKHIMESGWVEFILEYFTSCAQQMMQSEIDKFKGTVQLLHDYYHAIEEKLIPEPPESVTVDLLKEDGTELPEVEKLVDGGDATDAHSYTYPRLDDFFKRALKAQMVPDVTAQAGDTGKKGAPAKGAKDVKGAKGGEDAGKPDSIYIQEMKEAIKVEKSILRFRLTQIRNWALNRLKQQRELSLKIYKKLDDWIQVSYQAENDAIEQVCEVIKDAIEAQTKIQVELRINFMDFVVDKSVFNFIEPPPEKLAAMEQPDNQRFNIKQLQSLVRELSMIAGPDNNIPNRQVVDLFVRKSKNSASLVDIGGLPKSWNGLKQADFERMVRNLDINNSGAINYKFLATCCILLHSTIPTDLQIENLKRAMREIDITANCWQDNLTGQACEWFEHTEKSKDREYSHAFPRVAMIKDLLFELHAENGILNMPNFTHMLAAYKYKIHFKGAKTYKEILFA